MMAVRRWWVWALFALVGVFVLLLVGIWLSARWWPLAVGQHLPLRVAVLMAGWGDMEEAAAEVSVDAASRSPVGVDNGSYILAGMLRSDEKSRQLAFRFLQFIRPSPFLTGECAEVVFALTTDPDPETRIAARFVWVGSRKAVSDLMELARSGAPLSGKAAAPDGWVPDPATLPAFLLNSLLACGHDHKTPNAYRVIAQELLALIIAREREPGWWSDDPASQAITLMALAEAYAMTLDQTLRPLVERGQERLSTTSAASLAQIWMQDTTTACLLTLCQGSVQASATAKQPLLQVTENLRRLRESYDAWAATGTDASPPAWRSHGQDVAVAEAERWAVLLAGAQFTHADPFRWPKLPPPSLAQMHSWSPLGGYLSLVTLAWGYRLQGSPACAPWHDALDQRRTYYDLTVLVTPDHAGREGWFTAHPTYGDEWETLFAIMQNGVRY